MFWIEVAEIVVIGLIVTVPLVLMFLLVYALRQGTQRGQAASTEETRLVQELLQGLKKLEDRMNSLETILLERGRKD